MEATKKVPVLFGKHPYLVADDKQGDGVALGPEKLCLGVQAVWGRELWTC